MEDLPELTHAIVAARIPYANVAPFYALWHEAPFAVRNLVPRDLGREAEAGRVDFGSMAAGAQGDVTLEEMKENIGDKILLDGIPAVLFLEHHPFEQLQECTERVVKLFHPNLVLGVSDELPEGGGPEAFRRLKWVADWCKTQR